MTEVRILTLDVDGRATVERIEHAPPAPTRGTVARLMDIRREAEALGADYLLALVRVALAGTERAALEWGDVLDQHLAAEREALRGNPVVQGILRTTGDDERFIADLADVDRGVERAL